MNKANENDFERIVPRYNKGSKKWDEMKAVNPAVTEDIVPFSVADMEFMTAPDIVEGLKKFLDDNILGYANAWDEYKCAVCNWMKRRHGWDIHPEWIYNTHGVVDAFYEAVKAFTKENDGVMLMTPIYYPMYRAISANKRVLVENRLVKDGNSYCIDFDDFEKKAKDPNTKVLILCSPHNPCGRVWTREELEKIGRICIDNNVLVVSDEIHFDFVSPGHKHIVFASISEEFASHCLTLTAPSKTFNLAGLQTTNVIISNKELAERFVTELETSSINPKCNILGYEACRLAYENCEEWIDEANRIIIKNRDIITEFMNREFPQVKISELQGTYLLWMDFNALGIDHLELERIMRMEAQLFFDEGYIFGEEGKGFERWNLACPTKCIMPALERMKNALDKYLK